MKKKIFTLLFTALMSVGMYAETTVTWDSNTISSISMREGGQSFTKDGVTLTLLDGRIAGTRDWRGNSVEASFKFSTSLGNFTRIEMTATINGLEGSGWTQTSPGAVWTGDANETTFGIYFKNVSQIVFTIAEPAPQPTTHTLQLHVNDAAMGSVALQNPSNDIIDNGDGTYTVPEGAEVTLLATPNEGYEFTGWKASSSICEFTECEFVALPTVDNPLTVDMYMTAAFMAEFAAVTPTPATTTVTWNNSTLSSIDMHEGDSFTEGGVTLTVLDGKIDGMDGEWKGYSNDALKFSTSLGNFTRIEITATINRLGGSGWTETSPGAVWTGDANETTFSGNFENVSQIVFTIEESQGGTTSVENVQTNQVQATKFFRDGQLLIEKNGKIYNVQGAEVK